MTSNDEKTMHQISIEDALAQIDRLVHEGHADYARVGVALAAEVRRLREQLNHFIGGTQYLAMSAEIDRLSEELKVERVAKTLINASHARELDLREKLARVEALPAQWRGAAMSVNQPDSPSLLVDCADELEEALRE